ncbi:nucleosome assembly protein 1,4 [Tanacetum coccineum]
MHVSDQDLDLLAKTRGKDLHTLKICTCTGFSEKGLLHISQYCNDLTSLCLEDNGVEDDNELVGKANGEWLRELALRNTSIESLHLRYDFDLYDVENFTLLAEKCSNSLVSLKISPKPLNLLVDAFSHAIKLEDLDGDVPIWRCLDVALLDISNEAFECVGTHLNNLRKFCMFLFKKAGISLTGLPLDNGIRAMLKGCIKLKRLTLSLCDGGLTDVGLGYIGKYGHNLRNLFLSCKGVSIAGLLELSKGCPKLRKLYLDDCRLSEQAVAAFVFDIHSLRYV